MGMRQSEQQIYGPSRALSRRRSAAAATDVPEGAADAVATEGGGHPPVPPGALFLDRSRDPFSQRLKLTNECWRYGHLARDCRRRCPAANVDTADCTPQTSEDGGPEDGKLL